jgi:predicted membrane chloride channel (bestrophin family)
LVLLPLALWPTHAWAAVPAAALISFVLLGIEEIGVEIEVSAGAEGSWG